MANDVDAENKKTAVFLSVIGAKTYEVLKSLIAPEKPSTKTYLELKDALTKHYKPKPLVIYERFKFHKASQNEHETVSDYLANLRKLSQHCDFKTFLDDSLRDKFVCGLRNIQVQQRLLQMENLTLDKAVKIAQAMESAEQNASQLHEQFASKVHFVKSDRKESHRKIGQGQNKITKFQNSGSTKCYRCGYTNHTPNKCKYKDYVCNKCQKKGHLSKVCKSKERKHENTHMIDREVEFEEEEEFIFTTEIKSNKNKNTFMIRMNLKGKVVPMQIDTGSGVTVMPESSFRETFSEKELILQPTNQVLRSYNGTTIPLAGEVHVPVKSSGETTVLRLLIAQVPHRSTVLGRDWLQKLKINWENVFSTAGTLQEVKSLDALLKKHGNIFSSKLQELKGTKARIVLKKDAESKFYKPRPVPYALRDQVATELQKLESNGVVTRVTHSDWASPIVVVPKTNGSVRICGDFKVTINYQMKVDQYPLQIHVQDILSNLSNGKKFTKLDMTKAYHQMALEEDSKPYVTINTHCGLFRYNRLPYGVASGPAIFQKYMEEILTGIPGVQVFIDDIQITGKDDKDHLDNLGRVFQRLEENRVSLNKDKCLFMKDQIDYLGHTIDSKGIRPQDDKVKAVLNVPQPQDIKELRSFLGGVQYYSKFLPNLSDMLKPLNDLLKKDSDWNWSKECEKSFQQVKEMLSSKTVLTHYNPKLPVILATDASMKGLGAVISHKTANGEEKPIAYASRSLSTAERNYAQIEKEALGIMFGVRKFHQYLYGRSFTLITDHKPLIKIFGPKTDLPAMAAAKIQRWSVELSNFQYDIQYRRSEDHCNADMLSRLPQSSNPSEKEEKTDVFFTYVNDLPVSAAEIAEETKKDPVLSKVLRFTLDGWPAYTDEETLKLYFNKKDEITIEAGVLQWGVRVLIPHKFRQRLLHELHEGHQGMSQSKAIARSYIYWPDIDKDIEVMVKECRSCASIKNNPPAAPVFAWTFPSKPWERIHVDFADFEGQKYFLVIDAFSKWPEIVPMTTTTAERTNNVLRQLFAIHGLPHTLVSDNGPPFLSTEFKLFLKRNGIKHITSQPYMPSINGPAERLVQTFKQRMKSSSDSILGPQKLAKILLQLRSTPHTMTGKSPAELLFNRKLRIRLDLIKPNFVLDMREKQESKAKSCKLRSFEPGKNVKVRNYRSGLPKWSDGVILSRRGTVSYEVRVNGGVRHCHIDQLVSSPVSPDDSDRKQMVIPVDIEENLDFVPNHQKRVGSPVQNFDSTRQPPTPNGDPTERPKRVRKPPNRLDL